MAEDLRYLESSIAQLMAKADVIQEEDDLTTYLGFCQRGATAVDDPVWAVCRIQQSQLLKPRATTIMWSEGFNQPRFKFSDYAILNYKFKNF